MLCFYHDFLFDIFILKFSGFYHGYFHWHHHIAYIYRGDFETRTDIVRAISYAVWAQIGNNLLSYYCFLQEADDNDYQTEDSGSDVTDSDIDIDENDEVKSDGEGDGESKRKRRLVTKAYKVKTVRIIFMVVYIIGTVSSWVKIGCHVNFMRSPKAAIDQ